ncbi:hypothetical protein WJX81_007119 [Elliptochloris bilobata]|uniref:Sugar phosphate transporter domain-containing protein n=1 Tax=Elliptochloris bilobata TaxID=381761 RepID=A0AAW1QAW7_9CHLO
MLERGAGGAESSGLRSIPEDKAFLQSPRPSGETRHASLRHALQNSLVRTALKNGALICTWYFFSTLLSLWNRTLLGKGHGIFGKGAFPAPMLMSSLQFASQIFMARLVLAAGLVKRKNPEKLSWHQYCIQVVPNGTATGLDIGLSNFSLSLITLSFYTMCKSTTPIFLLAFCFLWGIEKPSWSLAGVVGVISAGLALLVAGETQFDALGFALVMAASALSGLRWTITQLQLQGSEGHGSSGGPVEVLLSLMPVMSVTVGVMSLLVERLWAVMPGSPYFDSAAALALTGGLMLFGGLIAFLMVWVEFTVINETSALTFMVAGTFKEIVTVVAAVVFLGESFSRINALGLCVLVAGVFLFNWSKYRKIARGQARGGKPPGGAGAAHREDGNDADEEAVRLVSRATSGVGNGGPGSAGSSPRAPASAFAIGVSQDSTQLRATSLAPLGAERAAVANGIS